MDRKRFRRYIKCRCQIQIANPDFHDVHQGLDGLEISRLSRQGRQVLKSRTIKLLMIAHDHYILPHSLPPPPLALSSLSRQSKTPGVVEKDQLHSRIYID